MIHFSEHIPVIKRCMTVLNLWHKQSVLALSCIKLYTLYLHSQKHLSVVCQIAT